MGRIAVLQIAAAIAVIVVLLGALGYWALSLTAAVPIPLDRIAGPFVAFAGGGLVLILAFIFLIFRGRR